MQPQNNQPNQLPQSQNNTDREPLKWLFVAEFNDGTIIKQTQEDKCTTRTDGTGSAFTDVLARKNELVGFSLVNGEHYTTVDLSTGSFIINDTPFIAHDQNFDPSKYNLQLIYFRESMIDIVQSTEESKATRHYTNRYFIGWQCQDKHGKNHQITIAVG